MYRFSVAAVAAAILLPTLAFAQDARLESLGGEDLLTEDASNVFTNPALAGVYSNRVFFSLGVTGGGGAVGVDPHGGAFVTIKDTVTLGVVLNRSPRNYGFDRAFWPVLTEYMPSGPGGDLQGPDGPVETSAPLRFPADVFISFGNPWSALRLGFNLYYAGGAERTWEVDDSDQDDLIESIVTRKQTHLINGTVGLSGGSLADRVRGEGWVRVTYMSAWHDEQGEVDVSAGETEPTTDMVLSMDRDMRIGGGARIHIGEHGHGLVVSPGLQYDIAFGAFRFDDNLVAPDSNAENAQRNVTAHDAKIGVGLSWHKDDLLVHGAAAIGVHALTRIDTLDTSGDGVERSTDSHVDLLLPEISIGAEYRLLPVLFVRAGIRSTVVGGRTFTTVREAEGPDDELFESNVVQTIRPGTVGVNVAATGGLGLEIKRFRADAIFGGLFLPTGDASGINYFTRLDLAFSFD